MRFSFNLARLGFRGRLFIFFAATIASAEPVSAAENLARRQWTVDGVTREALLAMPPAAKIRPTPVVFAFHGHGGTMQNAAKKFAYHRHWAESIVVYPQGLNTPGGVTDPEGKRAGWQTTEGVLRDRDLKFFDAMLATLQREYRVDPHRVYATGHSNGGGFTYLLWAARGDVFAATAPCAAGFRRILDLKPKPVFVMAGEQDPIVRFERQKLAIDRLRNLNDCREGRVLAEHCALYPSPHGNAVVTYIHPGGHELPNEVPPLIVKFFQEVSARSAK